MAPKKTDDKKYYGQMILDKEKEEERIIAEYCESLEKKGWAKKKILLEAVKRMMMDENNDNPNENIQAAVAEGNKQIIEEIRDLKVIIRSIAGISITQNNSEKDHMRTIPIVEQAISEDEIHNI